MRQVSESSTCFICGTPLDSVPNHYVVCNQCGHHHATAAGVSGAVDNEVLDVKRSMQLDALTRAQIKLTIATALSNRTLLDLGSGTGKFLWHARAYFDRVVGVEVSHKSVSFATKNLGLTVYADVALTEGPFDIVTSWHVLEHVPGAILPKLLEKLRSRCHEKSKIIICVPNPDSWAPRVLGTRWAFCDLGAHLHEFSRRSLDQLLAQSGFRPERTARFFVYTLFTWVQSLANLTPLLPHNYLYYRLKRGDDFGWSRGVRVIGDLFAVIVLLPALMVGVCLAYLSTSAIRKNQSIWLCIASCNHR